MTRSLRLRHGWVLAGAVLAGLGAQYALMRNSSWVFDDNFFLVIAGREGFPHFLTATQFEHWDIGDNALFLLVHRLFYLDYRWALAFLLVLLGFAAVVFERSLGLLIRSRSVTIAVTGWFVLNLLWVRQLEWWSTGVQAIPFTLFDLLCLYGFLRYHAGSGRGWIALSAGALACGLLFYEKPAFMIGYLLLLRVLLLSRASRPAAVVRMVLREWWIWASYAVVVGVWVIGYVHSGALVSRPSPSVGEYASFFRILFTRSLVPSIFGVTIPPGSLDAVQTAFVVLSELAVVGAFAVSVLRRHSAARAWLFLAVIILVDGVLIAHQRVPLFGVEVGETRYLAEYSWLVPITLCAAFARGDVLVPRLRPADERLALGAPSRRLATFACVGAVYAVAMLLAGAKSTSEWQGSKARNWQGNLRAGFAAIRRSGQKPVVADNLAPPEIVATALAPYNQLTYVLPLYLGAVQVDGPLDGPLYRVEGDGTLHRPAFQAPLGGTDPATLLRDRQASLSPGARSDRSGGALCVIADGAAESFSEALPTSTSTLPIPYYLHLSYTTFGAVELPVVVLGYEVGSPPQDYAVRLGGGTGSSVAFVGAGPPKSIQIVVPPLTTVCLRGVEVTTLGAAAA